MSQMTPESECFQYADDTTLYRACKASQRHACINNSIEKNVHSILIQILFLTVQKQKLWSYRLHKCLNITNLKKKNKRKMQ